MNAPLGRKALAIATLFALFGATVAGVVGCARLPMAFRVGVGISAPEAAATASPEDVIRAYWTAKNQATRDALSSDYKLEQEAEWRRGRNAAGSQSDDIDSASVSVDKSRPCDAGELRGRPDRYRGYFAVRETQVHYVLPNNSDFERAGSALKFVIVVKKTKDSPWRVEEMGTGP